MWYNGASSNHKILTKTKAPTIEIVGAFESLASALAVIFFHSLRYFKPPRPPDPKP